MPFLMNAADIPGAASDPSASRSTPDNEDTELQIVNENEPLETYEK